MKAWNKKGIGLLILVGLGVVFASFMMALLIEPVQFQETIGIKQYNLLTTNEKVQAIDLYLEEALPYATKRAEDSVYASAGIATNSFGTGSSFRSLCGTHIYPLYTASFAQCLPEFRTAYKLYTEQNIKRYLDSYQSTTLMPNLAVDITSTSTRETNIQAQSISFPIEIPSKATFIEQEQVYPRGILGYYGNEKIILCGTGYCFAEVASYYNTLYEVAGLRLPYVAGGESPYSYEDTLADKESNPESIFKDAIISKYQQEGNTQRNSYTEAGFDSAGWLWWIGRHAGILELTKPKTLDVYYESLRANDEQIICDNKLQGKEKCTNQFVQTQAQEGDLLFVEEQGVVNHVMIYLGEGEVSHSQPGFGLTQGPIPSAYLTSLESHIATILRPQYYPNGKDYFLTPQGDEGTSQGTCVLPIDFSQINTQAIRSSRQHIVQNTEDAVQSFNQKLADTNQVDSVAYAAIQFPKIPESYIKAIMMTEVGYGAQAFQYLSGSTVSRPGSQYVGPMQLGKEECGEANKASPVEICNYNEIRKGGYDGASMAILSGTGYLSHLATTGKYLDSQQPNLYFLAIAYNAGPGSLNKILEAASRRTGIPETQLEWRDITRDDIRATGWGETKITEVYEYANLVAVALSGQCDGDYFADYRKTTSTMLYEAQLQTTSQLDLERLELIETFVDEVQTCNNNLDVCVKEKVQNFNREHNDFITITTDGESESFAYELADQALNCLKNEQSNCLCDVDIRPEEKRLIDTRLNPLSDKLQSAYDEPYIAFLTDGSVQVQTKNEEGKFETQENIITLPYSLSSIYDGDSYETLSVKPDFLNGRHQLLDEQEQVLIEDTDTTKFVLAKEGNFSLAPGQATQRAQLILDYAKEYLGTGYHTGDGLRDCTAEEARAGICLTQCGSFISSVYVYTLGSFAEYGPEIIPRGNGIDKCTQRPELFSQQFTDPNQLRPGDIFSSNGNTQYGHTGMYVGWGTVDTPARSDGYCYQNFNPSPLDGQGDFVFIHSVGPVCYNTLTQLVEEQKRDQMRFCRHELLEPTPEELAAQQAQEEEKENAPTLAWFAYNEEEHKQLMCRDNQHYYRFQTQFTNGQEGVSFSLYLNDSVAPSILQADIDRKLCGEKQVVVLEWSYPRDTEPLYQFTIQPTCQDSCPRPLIIKESSSELTDETDPTQLTKLNQLYKRETSSGTTYYFLMNRLNNQDIQPSSTYSFDILTYDHYLNEPESLSPQLSITTPTVSELQSAIELATGGTFIDGLLTNFVGDILDGCEDVSGFEYGEYEENVYGDITPDQIIGGAINETN